MYVTSSEQRAGLLAAVITGGRPALKQRPTRKFLEQLEPLGLAGIVWVVSESHAPAYERDGYPLCVYPDSWAYEYAAAHWMHLDPPQRGGFLGAFPGREWACLEAERRGCWGVLQLDDNIERVACARGNGVSVSVVMRNGGMGLFADVLAATTLSTSARIAGASLTSSPTVARSELKYARPGFPYSLFVEQVGTGREPWYGPFEDDITHAYQYGTRGDGATSATVPMLKYTKESTSTSGMRKQYDPTRAVQLQRIFPESAKLTVKTTKSNRVGFHPRVFHQTLPGAIRNPLTVTDPELFRGVRQTIDGLILQWQQATLVHNKAKVLRRAASVRVG